jgi:phosphatidylglycerol:prolipoprotein diacylglycerol transferase
VYPVLFSIGPLTIHTYGLFVALAFLVGLGLAIFQAKKEGIPHNTIADLGFYVLVASLVGSRLFFILINFSYYSRNPLDILKIWEGGLVFYGGVLLAVPTAIWFVVRHNLGIWRTADIFAPALAIGHALGRIGCFFAGCCYGKFTDSLPWGVVFSDPECLAPINVPLHPTQLYESAGEVLNFMILITLRRKKSFNGQLFMGYLILYSILRFFVEFFRGDIQRGFLTETLSVSQGISILIFCAGVAGYLLLQRKRGQMK